jgi:alkylated DNA repair dioxygenase AlkB
MDEMLTFDPGFLEMRHTWRLAPLKPSYSLTPPPAALLGSFTGFQPLGNRVQHLTNGLVCTNCHKCLPKIYWNKWVCSGCTATYEANPGKVDLAWIVNRPTVSYPGHPPLNPQCPPENLHTLAMARPLYKVDRFALHGGATIVLISPTMAMNSFGADNIWVNLLDDANAGRIDLQRTLMKPDREELGIRTNYFHATFGEKYDFSERPPLAAVEAPQPVISAINNVLIPLFKDEVGPDSEKPNSVQVLGYIGPTTLPWHTDGDEEVGPTTVTLSVGGDAEMRIRLQKKYYDGENFDPDNIIMGARFWKELQQLGTDIEQSAIGANEASDKYDFYLRDHGNDPRPEIVLPLIHGSVVIIQGQEFNGLYEVLHFTQS